MATQHTPGNALQLAQDLAALLKQHETGQATCLTMPGDANWLYNRIENLKSHAFSIIVAGGFNSGKSTLINALTGRSVLHDGAISTTAIITRLSHGASYQAKLVYKSGEEIILDWADYKDRKIDGLKSQDVQTLDVSVPFQALAAGVEIIDTPGLNEHEQRTRLVLDYLPNADAVIFVLDAVQPLRRDEVEFIHLLGRPPLENVFFVANRMDLVAPDNRKEVAQHLQAKLKQWLPPINGKVGGQPGRTRLFFTNAEAVLNRDAPDEGGKANEILDFHAFQKELIAFLDIDQRQQASLKGLAQELAELCYRIEQRRRSVETAYAQPLITLQQKYEQSLRKVKAAKEAAAHLTNQIAALGQAIGEQVYVNLMAYVDHLEKIWPEEVKSLDLSKVEKLNILSNRISTAEKEQLSEIVYVELKRYLAIKLLHWKQELPEAILPLIEDLTFKTREALALIALDMAELETGLMEGEDTAPQHALADRIIPPVESILGDKIHAIVKWSVFDDIGKAFKQPDTLKIVGLSAVGALLAAGAAIFGSNPIGIFIAALGAGLVHTFRTRHEQREFYKMMREETSSEKAFQDLGEEKIRRFQQSVRTVLEYEIGKSLFHEIRRQIMKQKQQLIDQVAEEFQTLADHTKLALDAHIARIQEQHKQILDRKKNGEHVVASELGRLNLFSHKFQELFEAYCQSVLGSPMSHEEIEQIGDARAKYLQNYVKILKGAAESNVCLPVPADETPDASTGEGRDIQNSLPTVVYNRTQTIINRILGFGASSGQLPPGYRESARTRLDRLIGLQSVKNNIKELEAFLATQSRRRREGKLTGEAPSLHLVFTGNPGTGKTTVAKIVGEIYRDIGLLKRGHTIPVGAGDLIAGFVGQTAPKTREKIESALDGVLFIDEAYSLVPSNPTESNFGKDVIPILLDAMESYRDRLVIIVAGYPDEMERFLNFDPGLPGRFPIDNHIHFPNYTPEELFEILTFHLSRGGYHLSNPATGAVKDAIRSYYEREAHKRTFDNGRYARSFAESLIRKLSVRIYQNKLPTDALIEVEDISPEYRRYLQQPVPIINPSAASALAADTSHSEPRPHATPSGERQRITDQKNVQTQTIMRQTHRGSGDNIYGDKYVYELKAEVGRELTLIPAPTRPWFGQAQTIEAIKTALSQKNRVALQSIGGRGKTSLVIQYIHQHADGFPHIAWLTCKTSIAQAFLESSELLSRVGIAFTDTTNENTRFRLLQSKLVEKIKLPTLIVIDNVGKRHEQELASLSLAPNFKILLTSRERIDGFELVELPPLDFEAAQALFCKNAERKKEELKAELLEDLFGRSDYHPTVIERLAKRFSSRYGTTLEDFVRELKDIRAGKSIAEFLSDLINASTLSDQEQFFIRQFSVLPPTYILPEDAINLLGFEADAFNSMAAALIQKGLLDEDKTLGLKCQQIIQEAVRVQLQPNRQNCLQMLEAMGELLSARIQGLSHRSLHQAASRILPLLQSVVEYMGTDDKLFAPIYKNLGIFAWVLGDFEQAKKWLEINMRIYQLADDATALQEVLHVYADICQAKGEYAEAEEILTNRIRFLHESPSSGLRDIGLAHEKLGMLHLRKGNLLEALEDLRHAVEAYEKLGEDNMTAEHKAQTSVNLGLALINIGRPQEAREILEEARGFFDGNNDALGMGHICHYLSIAHIASEEFQKADSYLKQAKRYLSNELPEDELIFAELYNNATIITINGFIKEDSTFDEQGIEDMLQNQIKAISILGRHRPENHPDYALYYYNLARLYKLSGDDRPATDWASRSIAILEQNSDGGKSLNLANFHFLVATEFEEMVNRNGIEYHLKQAIAALPTQAEYKAHLATFHLALGGAYADDDNFDEAAKHFKTSYDTYREAESEDHPFHAFSLYCLANCKRMTGQYSDALKAQAAVLDICRHLMPETDPEMAFAYCHMAQIHAAMKNFKDALMYREKARRVNSSYPDLAELENIGRLSLIKAQKQQQSIYAYIILPPDKPYQGSLSGDRLLIREYDNLEEAMREQAAVEAMYGKVEIHF